MAVDKSILIYFANYIEKELGIVYSDANFYQLEHRLNDIVTQLGLPDINALFQQAQMGIIGALKTLILDIATNNETSFFRDQSVFKAVTEYMIPKLIQSSPHKSMIRIWSAAASTDQEAYSLIMEIEDSRKKNPTWPSFSIFATDISEKVLKKGTDGVYSQLEVQRGLPARLLIQNFDKQEGLQWSIKPHLKSHVSFKKLNLLEPWGAIGPFDIVFCRNVLIYQKVENKQKVVNEIYKNLLPGGFLVLGAAESLIGVSDAFKQVSHNGSVFFEKSI